MSSPEGTSQAMTKQQEADRAWKNLREGIETSPPELIGKIIEMTEGYLRRISAEAYIEQMQK